MSNLDQVHKLLQGSYSSMPQPQDTEKCVNLLSDAVTTFTDLLRYRPKYYVPRNPYASPPYYPQSTNRLLNSSALFQQLDVETLFYVFYFLPGTYQQ